MTDLITHIRNGIAIAKSITEISQQAENSKLVKKIAELNLQLAQIQNEAADMLTELRELRDEAKEQKTNPIHYDGEVYRDSNGYPFCPGCYDNSRKRIHLQQERRNGNSKGFISWNCPICTNTFLRKTELKSNHL